MRQIVIGNCTLIHGDCRDAITQFEPSSIDVVISDPPYGNSNHDNDFNARLNEHRGIEDKPIANDGQDDMRDVVSDALSLLANGRLTEPCAVLMCCSGGGGPNGPQFAWLANRMDTLGLHFFHQVIWDKKNPGLGWRYRRRFEQIMVAHRRGGRLRWPNQKLAVANIIECMPPRERHHPNEKPFQLIGKLLDLHSAVGDTILDPFMGSGTTGVAAQRWGRKFVGCEIDDKYFDIACKRIEEAVNEPELCLGGKEVIPEQISILDL